MEPSEVENAIAIVGLSGRFPGSDSLEQFWQNLCNGTDSISTFTNDDLNDSVPKELLQNPNYVKARGILSDVEYFDADFFGIPPKEAQIIDPQHRLFLECAWEALEDAGYCVDQYTGSIGVFGGTGASSYYLNNIYPNKTLISSLGEALIHIGNNTDYLTTRVSYKMNLKGPSLNIQTACSTSLVSICVACDHLLSYQCDIAISGAAAIALPQKSGYLYQQGMIFSADGHCRPFDAKAGGTVPSNGVGVVVLKRLEDALADQDHIYAVIRGYGINNDGYRKVSFSAPSVEGQVDVISSAIAMSGVDPETITYVEAHGTGTYIGDPIEIEAITKAFQVFTEKKKFCALSSLKGNIGHTIEAAGVVGLIKTILAMQNQMLPPQANFEEQNPHIDFANSPFYVNRELTKWESLDSPCRACVSSFGMGGTNAHMILEEPMESKPSLSLRKHHVFVLSAKTPTALKMMISNLRNYLQTHPSLSPADVAYTLQVGRKVFEYKQAFVTSDLASLVSLLGQNQSEITSQPDEQEVVFLFSRLERGYPRMGYELYQNEPTYRYWIDTCHTLLKPHLEVDLLDILYATSPVEYSDQLQEKRALDCALFTTEYALAKLWEEWGIVPEKMVGNGIGEYVTGCLADVFSLEDGLKLLAGTSFSEAIELRPPSVVFSSQVSGDWIRVEEATKAEYWNQLSEGKNCLNVQDLVQKEAVIIEVDPSPGMEQVASVSSFPNQAKNEQEFLLQSLEAIFCAGITIDWNGFHKHEKRSRLSLPSYPFEKKYHWIEAVSPSNQPESHASTTFEGSNIETALLDIWKEHIGLESINTNDDFFTIGGDSLLAIQIVSRIEAVFGISLQLQAFLGASTIDQLKLVIQDMLGAEKNDRKEKLPSVLVKLKQGDPTRPLFLIHPIGGQLFCYKALMGLVTQDILIYGIHGEEDKSSSTDYQSSMEAMASRYLESIYQIQKEGPYRIAGFSFGGLITYEIARQIQESGKSLELLMMIDAIRPDQLTEKFGNENLDMLALLLELFERKPVAKSHLKQLSDQELLNKMMECMELGILPQSEKEQVFQQIKSHCNALAHYNPKGYTGDIVFVEAAERFFRTADTSCADTWKPLVKGHIDIHEVPGNHLNMMNTPCVEQIAKVLNENLK